MSAADDRHGLALAGYSLIGVGGWLAANVLLAIGALFVLFVLFANGTAVGFFAEAENLARHFGAASPGSRTQFLSWVKLFASAAFAVVCVMRLPGLARRPGAPGRGLFSQCSSQKGVLCHGS
jgi:hypothetical protein